ncbi:MAG: TetR/AcrR family transcriptional regulator [Bacillota bacterium]
MSSPFFKLNPEKQQRIINATMKEFALKGYKHASTNEIVKEANIGKGRLFHYFNSKKELYLFLYDYMVRILQEKLVEKIDWNEKDIFSRIQQSAVIKLNISSHYPELFQFLLSASSEAAEEVKHELEHRNKQLAQIGTLVKHDLFKDVDISKFKEDIDIKAGIEIISWTVESFSTREANKSLKEFDSERIITDMEVYLNVLKKCFYK